MTDYSTLLPAPKGDAVVVEKAGERLKLLADGETKLGGAFQAEATGMQGTWQSPQAAALAVSSATRLSGTANDFGARTARAGAALVTFSGQLREAQQRAVTLQHKAQDAEEAARASAQRQANQQPDLTAAQRQAIFSDVFRRELDQALQVLQRQHAEQVTGELDRAAQVCAQAMETAVPGYQPGMSPTAAATAAAAATAQRLPIAHGAALTALGGRGEDGLTPPAHGADPKKTAAWWNALTDEERTKIIQASHRELGNLNGIPGAARSQANQLSLAQDLTSADQQTRTNAQAVRTALDRTALQVDRVTGQKVTVQLLAYEPTAFGGDGRAAIAVGDVDTARHVAVSVPGITTTVATMSSQTDAAYNLYDASRQADGRTTTAVVAWMGYNAPSGWPIVEETPRTANAVEGAQLLADDVNGLRAARGDDQPHLTVIGHSYGSVTTGYAAANDGLAASDIVLLGSPGSTVPTAAGLNVGAGHVFVGSNSMDPVSRLGWFNTDPASVTYGGTRFQAETPLESANPIYYHTHYFDQNSESVANMSQIVTGHPDQITGALPRVPISPAPVLGPEIDPESFRRAQQPVAPAR